MPFHRLRRSLAAALALLAVPAAAGPLGPVPNLPSPLAAKLTPAAYSIAKITELLEARGYRNITFTDRLLPRYKAEACYGSEKFELKLNWWGDVVNRTKLGTCAGGSGKVAEANREIRYILRSKGFSRIRFVNPDPPKIIVEACREGARLRLELDRFGTTKSSDELGSCLAIDEDKTPVNLSLPDVLKREEVEEILSSQGFADLRFTDANLPRYVAEGCRGGNKFKLTINRYGEITDRRIIGSCVSTEVEDVANNPPPKRFTRAEIMRKGRLDPELCQEYFDFLLYDNSVRFDVASARIRSDSIDLLVQLAWVANRCPDATIEVSGHTDSDGSPSYNQDLSERRAEAVVAYLVSKDVRRSRLASIGFGEDRPLVSNTSAANKAKNRRIEFSARWE
jgi:outer membrane protein OmpA-like peptidoglycan-associated protein